MYLPRENDSLDISKLDERVRKAAFEGVNGMDPAEANQLMKDFATQMVKQQTLTEAYEYEFEGIGFAQEQAKRMSALRSEEEKRRVSALQGEIKALEVCVEEQKRKAVDDNLKLAQATRMVEKMERELCLDSPKGVGIRTFGGTTTRWGHVTKLSCGGDMLACFNLYLACLL